MTSYEMNFIKLLISADRLYRDRLANAVEKHDHEEVNQWLRTVAVPGRPGSDDHKTYLRVAKNLVAIGFAEVWPDDKGDYHFLLAD